MWGADCQPGGQRNPWDTASASPQWDLRPPRWVSPCHSSPRQVGQEVNPSHSLLIKDVPRTLRGAGQSRWALGAMQGPGHRGKELPRHEGSGTARGLEM